MIRVYLFPGKGKTIAYSLSDMMFSRGFFLPFSWTGLTNDKSFPGGKRAFKDYNQTIDLFLSVVNNADKSFGVTENKAFFQSLLQRSKHRLEDVTKKRKAPALKRRPRKINYKRNPKKKKVENEAVETNHDDNRAEPLLDNDENRKIDDDDQQSVHSSVVNSDGESTEIEDEGDSKSEKSEGSRSASPSSPSFEKV